jgi:FixJ family two-component response regulator
MTESSQGEANEVCVVDDDPSVLKSIHYLLASEGFKVRPFNKAEEFLAHAGTHHVPVVVTDIWMDQVTGLELLRASARSHRVRKPSSSLRVKIWRRAPQPWPSAPSHFS